MEEMRNLYRIFVENLWRGREHLEDLGEYLNGNRVGKRGLDASGLG
jgi:hypothetical protein